MEKTVPHTGLVHELCSDASHLAGLHAWYCLISIISSLGMAKTTGLWTRLVADGTIFRLLKGELPVAVAVLTAAGIAVMMSMFCVISATAMSRKAANTSI